ncbi:hypothetical protein [Bordetella genomosp. 9]|nr:hypothetical protein [Bordetella genomosp. 9]
MTSSELAAEVEMEKKSVRDALSLARRKGTIHITAWRVNEGGRRVAVYGPGAGEDAPLPEMPSKAKREVRRRLPTSVDIERIAASSQYFNPFNLGRGGQA